MIVPNKGDLIYIDLGSKQRPAIVLSPKPFNELTHNAVVCPITKKRKNYPFEVELPKGLSIEGVILTDQERSVDWKSRNVKIVGQAPESIIDTCIRRIHTFISL